MTRVKGMERKPPSNQTSRFSRPVRQGEKDGITLCAWGVLLLTNWAQFFLWRPANVVTLPMDAFSGAAASLVYLAWVMSYIRTRGDIQKRAARPYSRLRAATILLGCIFMSTSLR